MPAVLCTQCGSHYRVHAKLSGRQVKCRDCGEPIMVPGEAAAPIIATPRAARSTRSAPAAPPPPQTNDFFSGFTAASPPASKSASAPPPPPRLAGFGTVPALAPTAAVANPKDVEEHEPEYLPETPAEELGRAVEARNASAPAPARRWEWTGSSAQTGTVGAVIVGVLLIGFRIYNRLERNAAMDERRQERRQTEYEAERQIRTEQRRDETRRMIDDMDARNRAKQRNNQYPR